MTNWNVRLALQQGGVGTPAMTGSFINLLREPAAKHLTDLGHHFEGSTISGP